MTAPTACARCRMHDALCLCAMLPRLATRTRLVLFLHRYEDRKPSNTGLLAASCLAGAEVIRYGGSAAPPARFTCPPGTAPLLLFPDDDAVPLDQLPPLTHPVTLIVPDGNWRQAARLGAAIPGLLRVPRVTLPAGPPSRYRLRSEPRPGGLATLEAIARALGILDGPAVQAALEHLLDVMVERTLWARGLLDAAAVTGGIPAGVTRPSAARSARSAPPAADPG